MKNRNRPTLWVAGVFWVSLLAMSFTTASGQQLDREAFIERFNLRTIGGSLVQTLQYYCGSYPKDFFSKIKYLSESQIEMRMGTNWWTFTLEKGNQVVAENMIADGTYRSAETYDLLFFESLNEWRNNGDVFVDEPDDCVTYELSTQIVFGDGHYWFKNFTTYEDNHDPGWVELGNGEELTVSYADIPWEDVEGWKSGRKVTIEYHPKSGIQLADSESGRSIPVINYPREHPIDVIENACTDMAGDTLSYVDCYSQSLDAWDTELNRNYSKLMSVLDDAEQDAVRTAQRKWIEFRDAELKAIGLLSRRPGTIWSIRAAALAKALTKDQAKLLKGLLP